MCESLAISRYRVTIFNILFIFLFLTYIFYIKSDEKNNCLQNIDENSKYFFYYTTFSSYFWHRMFTLEPSNMCEFIATSVRIPCCYLFSFSYNLLHFTYRFFVKTYVTFLAVCIHKLAKNKVFYTQNYNGIYVYRSIF